MPSRTECTPWPRQWCTHLPPAPRLTQEDVLCSLRGHRQRNVLEPSTRSWPLSALPPSLLGANTLWSLRLMSAKLSPLPRPPLVPNTPDEPAIDRGLGNVLHVVASIVLVATAGGKRHTRDNHWGHPDRRSATELVELTHHEVFLTQYPFPAKHYPRYASCPGARTSRGHSSATDKDQPVLRRVDRYFEALQRFIDVRVVARDDQVALAIVATLARTRFTKA